MLNETYQQFKCFNSGIYTCFKECVFVLYPDNFLLESDSNFWIRMEWWAVFYKHHLFRFSEVKMCVVCVHTKTFPLNFSRSYSQQEKSVCFILHCTFTESSFLFHKLTVIKFSKKKALKYTQVKYYFFHVISTFRDPSEAWDMPSIMLIFWGFRALGLGQTSNLSWVEWNCSSCRLKLIFSSAQVKRRT